jgi:hypothetical protein
MAESRRRTAIREAIPIAAHDEVILIAAYADIFRYPGKC